MNMKQFKYALVLAEEKSVSRAAEELGISQPSLSQYIKKIEIEVNARLFDRSGNEVRLTDAGRAYIDAGRRILDIERQMVGMISDVNMNVTGSIIVGISPYRTVSVMPEVIRRFKDKYPGFKIVLEERTGNDLLEGTERGNFDFCITSASVDTKTLDVIEVMNEEVVLAVPSGMVKPAQTALGRKYPAVDISVLSAADVITLAKGQLMQRLLDNACEEYGITYRTSVCCTSIEAQLAMVKAGLGIALVPSGTDKLKSDGIGYYSIVQELPKRPIYAAYRKGQYLSKPMLYFIDVLKTLE